MERGTEVKKEMDSLFHMAKLLVIWYCKWVVKIQRRLIYLNQMWTFYSEVPKQDPLSQGLSIASNLRALSLVEIPQ